MADAKPSAAMPIAHCEEGKVRVKLPAGEWVLTAVCETGKQAGASPPPPPPQTGRVSPKRPMSYTFENVPYTEKLRRVMCASLQHCALQALVDENGLGHSVVIDGGSPLEDECRRVIKIGKNYGRPKMEELLGWLRRNRKDWDFPDLPPDGDPWWDEG